MARETLQHQQRQSRLFDLPPEVRDCIYRFALVKSAPISPQRASHRVEERSVLALLATSKRVRQEAGEIYLGSNTFRFHDDGELDGALSAFFGRLTCSTLKLCAVISLEASLGQHRERRCFRGYCVGSVEIDLSRPSITTMTSVRTNCCECSALELEHARDKVQGLLKGVAVERLDEGARRRLGSEVGIEFCATFECLHPDYGD